MKLSNVWNRLRGQDVRRKRVALPFTAAAQVESMEARQMLYASALFIPSTGELNIELNSSDSVRVSSANGAVLIEVSANGSAYTPLSSIGTIASSSVLSLVVLGGDDANTIDLNGVTAAAFTSLTSISVDAANGQDTVIGSPDFADSINGGHGEDTISGQGGNDTIVGGDGNDLISGGTGNDSINSGDGDDSVSGDDGDDTILAGNGQDTISGGNGNDSVAGANGQDSLLGDAGDDTLNGDGGTDTIDGGTGNDSILGGEFNDSLLGGDGNDTMNGQAGNDNIDGGAGDDSVLGGDGKDTVFGGDGNDFLNGNMGRDSINGGAGDDVCLGGCNSDSIDGGAGNDSVFGQAGNDTLIGGGGADLLSGGKGDDLVQSGDGSASLAISIAGASSILEGNSGLTSLVFTLTLSQASSVPVTVSVSTADGSATAGSDYVAVTNQVVTFAPGVTSQTINVSVNGDTTNEVDETVRLVMSAPTGSQLQNQEAIGTITNDDPSGTGLVALTGAFGGNAQLLSVNTATAATAVIAATTLTASVDMTATSPTTAIGLEAGFGGSPLDLFTMNTVTGAVTSTTALTGVPNNVFQQEGDVAFDPATNTLYAIFATGAGTSGNPHLWRINATTGAVTDAGNITVGGTNLASANDGTEFDNLAIRNGTLYAVISFVTGVNANFNDALFTIDPTTAAATLVGPLGINNGFPFGAMEYDASADRFFIVNGGTGDLLTVNPATGAATVIGNTGQSSVVGLAAGSSSAPAVAPRAVTVSNVSVTEGDQGTQTVTFNVTAQPGNGNVTVNYQTVDGTATAGQDYVPTSGILTFTGAGGTQSVTVTVNSDTSFEGDETFFLQLTSVTGATIASGSGIATIVNNDPTAVGDTLLGGDGNDTLIGSAGNDSINGGAGNDFVLAGDGNDFVLGGSGNDTLNGEAGDDTLDGQGGDDVLIGGGGNDTIIFGNGSGGSDTIEGDDGLNTLVVNGTASADTISVSTVSGAIVVVRGGASITAGGDVQSVVVNALGGDDTVTIGDLTDAGQVLLTINGGDGNDTLTAAGSNIDGVRLTLNGDNGNDSIVGSNGNDSINGGAGDDAANGRAGNDILTGGDGNDVLAGGDGNDTILGGAGNDFLTGQTGNDSIAGGDGNDTLRGFEGSDTLQGQSGDDLLNGMDGDDSILGGVGKDQVTGGAGNDTLDGGRNDDTINGNAGNDLIRGDHGNDYINAGTESDTVNGGDGHDTIIATDGNDLLNGGDGNDNINAGGGADIVSGGDGNDSILGGGGGDVILGGDGDDYINGQGGTDTIAGNQGVDVIVDPASEIDEQFVLSAELLTALEAAG